MMEMLSEIVTALDAKLAKTPLGNFYKERKRLKGGNAWSGEFLQIQRGATGARAGYAFHKGGREELQFNVGFEYDGEYFRYGVAFSFEPDRNLPDPVEVLVPKVECFNRVLPEFPELGSLECRCSIGRHLTVGRGDQPIHESMVRRGSFVFLGERVRVPKDGITTDILARAAQVLEMLWPLYHRIEALHRVPARSQDYKVARLCWNTNLWQEPSGRRGKVTDKDAFEGQQGFGHEEWLFDLSTLIDGWKYGFIQALNHSHAKYEGEKLSLLLYSIDHTSKLRFWVGAIDSLEVLSDKEAKRVTREFHRLGWLKAMREQVRSLGLLPETLNTAETLVNVRFRPEALRVFNPIPFPPEDLPAYYYGTLQNVPVKQAAILHPGTENETLVERNLQATKAVRHVYESTTEFDLIQAQWQKQLRLTLREDLPAGVKADVETKVDGHQLDAVLTYGAQRVFIELKARGTVRQVIRAALSQLLEYAYWPNADRCHALLIVGAHAANTDDLGYLSMLRERFGLPIHYLQYRNGRIVNIGRWFQSFVTGRDPSASIPPKQRNGKRPAAPGSSRHAADGGRE